MIDDNYALSVDDTKEIRDGTLDSGKSHIDDMI